MGDGERGPEAGLRDYGRIFWRRKWYVIITVLVIVAAVVGRDTLKKPVYQSSARLLLTNQSTQASSLLSGSSTGKSSVDVPTQIQIFQSGPVAQAVHKALKRPAPGVTVAAVGNTRVVNVTVSASSPRFAAKAANAYATSYIAITRIQYISQELANENQLQSQINQLQGTIAKLQADNPATPTKGSTSDVQGQIGNDNLRLNTLQSQLQADQAAVAAAPGAALVLAKAVPNPTPASPKKTRDALIALAAGLIIGLALALIVEYADDRIITRADLERVLGDRPAIGLIPTVAGWRDRKEALLVSDARPKSPPAEAYRSLRAALRFMSIDRPLRILQVTSPAAAEGKTATSANLAVAMAQAGQRIALVSCDLRKPRLHKFFDMDNAVGFTDVVVGEATLEEALRPVEQFEGLYLLPSGPVPPNPSELLSSMRTRNLLQAMGEDFDLVIVDSPPVLPVSDATVIGAHSDAVLLVTAGRVSKRREARRAIELLRRVNAFIIGGVLNLATQSDSYVYYRYGYDSDYGPYRPDEDALTPAGNGHGNGNGSHGINGAKGVKATNGASATKETKDQLAEVPAVTLTAEEPEPPTAEAHAQGAAPVEGHVETALAPENPPLATPEAGAGPSPKAGGSPGVSDHEGPTPPGGDGQRKKNPAASARPRRASTRNTGRGTNRATKSSPPGGTGDGGNQTSGAENE